MKSLPRFFASFGILFLCISPAFAQNKDWLIKMQDPDINFLELQNEFNDYWKDRTDYKGNGYKVFKRWEYINELRVTPDGKLPAPNHLMKEYKRYMAEAPALKSASGAWSLIGPLGYPSNNTGQPTGKGRVNVIAFHPADVNTLYLGSPSGGIWKSANGGANWTNLSANLPQLGVSAILIHPSDPNIIYIGTGDRDGGDAPGLGVYKSTDGGSTWTQTNTGMGNVTVGMLLMHPSDPNTLIAATKSGIYKSSNAGAGWSLKQAGDFRDIKFKPGDPTVMYATRMVTPSEFYRSTNTGDNWTQITTPTTGVGSRMVIGVSPASPNYVYLVQITNTDKTFKAFLKSTDSGLTFTEQSNSPNIFDYKCDGSGTASQATYDLCIEVDRTNADIVYVGSINSWKSTNGGVSWLPATHWVGSNFAPGDPTANCAASVHADHHWYEWSPLHSPARLYLGHDGGISYTADGGATWTEISNDMSTGQVYKVGQAAQAANTVMAGFQDNGVSATNTGGAGFTTIGGGDGFECVVDYSNINFCYQASQNGNMRRSTTGVFGSYSSTFNGLVTDNAAFSAPYRLHRTDPNTMYLGRENVWRSVNVKAIPSSSVIWEAVSSFAAGPTVRVMEQSPANLDIMYISRGTFPSVLYRSDNVNAAANTVVWNAIPTPNSFNVSDIKAHPTDANIVYATAGMQIFKSTDKGASWTDITGNLPQLFINCLVLDKDANEGIYIGNETGVWYKDASISEWILFSSDLPPVNIRELDIYYDANPDNSRITAATYGRGVWQSDLAVVNVINPSNLAATPVSTTQIDLSWVLNASGNNVLIAASPTTTFGVPADGTAYAAGNTLPGGGTVIYAGNLTNYSHTGLTAGATYCYKIWSVNGGNQYSAGLPPVCATTFSHNWTGNVNTDWFNTGNWGPGTVPAATDGAYIPAGRPFYPLINAAGATCYHLTIESGASVSMDATTGYTLQVTGDWTNNGTFTYGIGTVEFSGTNALQKITGTSTTDFYVLKVDKGNAAKVLEATAPISTSQYLVILSGTFILDNSSSSVIIGSTTGDRTISSSKGIWLKAGTMTSTGTLYSWGGNIKVSGGLLDLNNRTLEYGNNGEIIVEGGQVLVIRIQPNSTGLTVKYSQYGGEVIVAATASTSTSRAPFDLSSGSSFTMYGGTITVRRSSSFTSDYSNLASTVNVNGGTLKIGDASTPAGQTIRINSTTPVYDLTVNAANAPTARLITNNLTVKNDLTISGGAFDANGLNLNVGGHWTNDGTFTSGTGTVTFNGAANQNLGGSAATTFNNLTMNNAAGLTLSGSVNTTVDGTLDLTSGVISTGANKVIIPASGSVSRTSGHIFGNLQKNVAAGAGVGRTFEIGDATPANYTPVALTFANVSAAGDLTAQTVTGDHPQIGSATLNASKSVNRYWSLTNSGTTFTTYDAVFNFLTADLDLTANTASLLAGKYDTPNWSYPTVGTQTANSTEITGETSFSDFQLAEASCVNPDVPTLSATFTTICAGESTTLSIASGNLNGAANWQWYSGSCGGTPVGSGTSIMVSPGATTTYYARGEGGCVGTPGACGSIMISVNSLPTPTITGPTSVCSGGSVTLDAGAGYSSYAWSHSGGSGQTAMYTNITTNTTYTVTVTDGNGCQGTDTHDVTVNANLTPTITGPTSVCSGGSATLDAGTGYSSYAWSHSGGSGQTAMYSNITTNTTYTVTVTDGNGCQGTDTHDVMVNPLPTPTVTGPTSVCSGGSATLDAGAGYSTYAWSHSGGSGQTAMYTNITMNTTYTVTVTDANGCQGTDTHDVTVGGACNIEFSGTIKWEHDGTGGVNNATVNLTGAGTGNDLTDINGDYLIFIPYTTGNFTLKPVKNINKLNGVTAADVSAIQQHVANIALLPGPFKRIAADVNKNNSITTADATILNQALLGNPSAINQITSWRFVSSSYSFPNPNIPWGFPEQINLTGVNTNQSGQNFKGVKTGDVVATWANPANFGAGKPLVWRVQDRVLQAGETVEAEFRADQLDDLIAVQMALYFDPEQLEFVAIYPESTLPVTLGNFGTYNLAEGEIRFVWSQAASVAIPEAGEVFRLTFKALQSGAKLSEALSQNEDILPALAYNSDLAESKVELKFNETTNTGDPVGASSLQLFQNRPNPFSGTTVIAFVLPEAGEAQLRVFDVSGRMLAERKGQYPAGKNGETFDLSGATGVLWYELTTPFGVLTRKMATTRK